MSERAIKITQLYPELSQNQAKEVDDFLVQKTNEILQGITDTRLENYKSEMIVALLLAYVHNNIQGLTQ